MITKLKNLTLITLAFALIALTFSLSACTKADEPTPEANSATTEKTVTVAFFVEDENATKVVQESTMELSESNFEKDFLKALETKYEIKAKSFSIKGERAVLDLDKSMAQKLNQGSTGSWMMVSKIYKTIFSIGNIKEIQVLVDGVEDVEADHYSFEGVMTPEKFAEAEKGYMGEQ